MKKRNLFWVGVMAVITEVIMITTIIIKDRPDLLYFCIIPIFIFLAQVVKNKI